jgi:hypothetical protein
MRVGELVIRSGKFSLHLFSSLLLNPASCVHPLRFNRGSDA